jgi:hypothetical protein
MIINMHISAMRMWEWTPQPSDDRQLITVQLQIAIVHCHSEGKLFDACLFLVRISLFYADLRDSHAIKCSSCDFHVECMQLLPAHVTWHDALHDTLLVFDKSTTYF